MKKQGGENERNQGNRTRSSIDWTGQGGAWLGKAGHGLGWFPSRKEAIEARDAFLTSQIREDTIQPLLNRLQQVANSCDNFTFKVGHGVRV